MIKRDFIACILLNILLISCDNNSTETTNRNTKEKQTVSIPSKETVDNNFNNFFEKFSSDSAFQISRTKFPLKIKWYDIENDRDSFIYMDGSNFEMIDFRKKNSTGHYDQWEQKIKVNGNNTSATIQIRGIENGIIVDYLLKKSHRQ